MKSFLKLGVPSFPTKLGVRLSSFEPITRTWTSRAYFSLSIYTRRPQKTVALRISSEISWQSTQHRSRRYYSIQRIPADTNDLLPDDSLSVPGSGLSVNPKNEKISCVYFNKVGKLDSTPQSLTKAQIAEQFELRQRDLRDIDLKSEGVTRILVRSSTILLQFFHMAMIIQADEALLINNASAQSEGKNLDEEAIKAMQARRDEFYTDFEKRMSGSGFETADIPELPYELRAVEAALVAVLSTLHKEFTVARDKAEESAQNLKLDSGAGSIGLDRVFERTRTLSKIESKARLVRDSLRELLDADDDLAGMYLTDRLAGKPHDISDHQEAEYMLEAYHKAADTLVESSQAWIDILRKKENTFRSSLAVQRNQIMFLEARIAIHTLGLAAGTMIAGLFGMNLVNYLEESSYGFFWVTGFCVVLSSMFSMYGMRSLWRIQSLKGIQKPKRHGKS